MVPHGVMSVDALPRTANGKVDRKRLPAPDWASAARERSAEITKPSTPQEKTIAEIWAQVLKIAEVGVDQSIFELGGDSLHIFQIVARANKEGIAITPRHILEHRTIHGVLKALTAGSSTAKSVQMHSVRREQYRIAQTGN
jgi:aryl carrier-like protein